ncbi:thioesterase II family protein [Paenibacillus xylaniclasticus]|uniref:thioesterase II family protein n=1 Tax=Paenibacillus xylaniclasticus TaxID=588083 RepID=UPI0013E0C194|nr:alpha/beta fold hydrolase [Paenibacillus xylaniclasticus]
MKLFCLPYAGASANIYSRWSKYITYPGVDIEIVPVELAGRGRRIGEPFYDGIDAAAQDAAGIIEHELSDYSGPYAIFGHSMGSLIAFEVCRTLQERNVPPTRLFVSGRKAPHLPHSKRIVHALPEDEFIQAIMAYEGTPIEVFQHKELAEMFIPILRADFRIVETYRYELAKGLLRIPVEVLYGDEDNTEAEASAWAAVTTSTCSIHRFQGGHFFIHHRTQEVGRHITNTLIADIETISSF